MKRQIFESNLEKEGLQIEYVDTPGVTLHFIKLHAPDEVLRRYAEILKLRMPMKLVSFQYGYIIYCLCLNVFWNYLD